MTDFKKGPFTMKDGKPTDAAIFKDELSQENEEEVDSAIFLREMNKKAKLEKAKRKVNESLGNLMESFK